MASLETQSQQHAFLSLKDDEYIENQRIHYVNMNHILYITLGKEWIRLWVSHGKDYFNICLSEKEKLETYLGFELIEWETGLGSSTG